MSQPLRKSNTDITVLLQRYEEGDSTALEALIPLVYDQLKKIASNQMRAQVPSHTLGSTGLVHETFIKLKEAGVLKANDRGHFFAIAARTMRWLLTDYARNKKREKRGGNDIKQVLFNEGFHSPLGSTEFIRLEEALKKLETMEPRLCRIVELRHLVGLTIEETAAILNISPMTVKRDWTAAKAWLSRELEIDIKT